MGADQQLGVVVFAQLGCHGPRKLFGGQRELRVDAGLVATWILPVATALQVNGNESMHIEGRAIVSEPLIAQPGRDTFGPEQGSEKMCRGETETDALAKCLRSAHGDPGILDVPGVTHPVTHVLKCRPGEGHIVGVLSPQSAGEPPDRGVGQVDDFIPGQVLRRCKSLQLQDLLLVHSAAISAGRAPAPDAWTHPMTDPAIDTSPKDIGVTVRDGGCGAPANLDPRDVWLR